MRRNIFQPSPSKSSFQRTIILSRLRVDFALRVMSLDRQAEASAAVAELLQLVPDFKKPGRETIQRIWRYQQPIELLREGLRKAGLELI